MTRIKTTATRSQPQQPHPPENKSQEMTMSSNQAYEAVDVRYQTGQDLILRLWRSLRTDRKKIWMDMYNLNYVSWCHV